MSGLNLKVQIEIDGQLVQAGHITGSSFQDAVFAYDESYISSPAAQAISLSLPLSKKDFDADVTKTFFDGLLPEGFTRQCVADSIHASSDDYISILRELGSECLGAIQIIDENKPYINAGYTLLTIEEITELAKEGASKSAEIVVKSHLSLTGASGKVGLYYDESSDKWYKPKGLAPSTHIVNIHRTGAQFHLISVMVESVIRLSFFIQGEERRDLQIHKTDVVGMLRHHRHHGKIAAVPVKNSGGGFAVFLNESYTV